MSESLLYTRRSARKAAAVAAGALDDVLFVAVGMVCRKVPHGPPLLAPPESSPESEPPPADGKGGSIEITLPTGTRVNVDAFVNEKALPRVLRAMKGLA